VAGAAKQKTLHQIRPLKSKFLCDHASHRSAKDMSFGYPRGSEYGSRIARHLPNGVGAARRITTADTPIIVQDYAV
jgi:hypothetical protein